MEHEKQVPKRMKFNLPVRLRRRNRLCPVIFHDSVKLLMTTKIKALKVV